VKPVMAVDAIGHTPMLPRMTECGTVEMPVLARIVNSAAVPRSTGAVVSCRLRVANASANPKKDASIGIFFGLTNWINRRCRFMYSG